MSANGPESRRALVVGWFSFVDGHATAGDLLSRDLACGWLAECGWAYDVATAPPFAGDVELESADPAAYSHVVFVCGPFQQGELEARLLRRFGHRRLIGLNLSMGATAEGWQPFDLLIERDSATRTNADIVFLSRRPLVPVAGVCLVEDYPGALVAYVPSLRWVYSGPAATPLYFDMVVARIRDRGWAVDRIGSVRSLTQPIPARTASR